MSAYLLSMTGPTSQLRYYHPVIASSAAGTLAAFALRHLAPKAFQGMTTEMGILFQVAATVTGVFAYKIGKTSKYSQTDGFKLVVGLASYLAGWQALHYAGYSIRHIFTIANVVAGFGVHYFMHRTFSTY